MQPGFLFALMALAAAGDLRAAQDEVRVVGPEPEPEPPRPRRLTPKDPKFHACPRCHAPQGKNCDRRTLGRKRYHMARVRLAGGGA